MFSVLIVIKLEFSLCGVIYTPRKFPTLEHFNTEFHIKDAQPVQGKKQSV